MRRYTLASISRPSAAAAHTPHTPCRGLLEELFAEERLDIRRDVHIRLAAVFRLLA